MATIEELQNALVQADAAGDVEGAKALANHIRSINSAPAPEMAVSREPNLGVLGNTIYGAAKGAADLVQAPAQIAINSANTLAQNVAPDSGVARYIGDKTRQFNEHLSNQEQQYQQETPDSIAAGVGRTIANVAPFIASGGSSAVPQIGKAAQLAQALAKGGGMSMISQPINQVQTDADGQNDFMAQKAIQGGLGAAGGALGLGLGGLAKKVISPNVSASAQAAMKENINPTIGQLLGGGYAAVENKLTSVPFLGDVIKKAQARTLDDFNRAAYNRAQGPIGQSAKDLPVGNEGVEAVRSALSGAYKDVLGKVNFKGDKQFGDELINLVQMANNGNIPPSVSEQFNKIVKNNVLSRMTANGTMDGPQYKILESDLLQKAKAFSSSADPNQRELGSALSSVVDSLKGALARSNPNEAPTLNKINEGWANYARIRGAASGASTNEGAFTPAQLASAVRSQDKSVGKGNFATGKALMQDLANIGKNIAPKYPDSGTLGRFAIPAAVVGALAQPQLAVPVGIAGAIAALPYTAPGQKIAAKLLASRPASAPAIANSTKGIAQALGGLGVPLLAPQFQGGS